MTTLPQIDVVAALIYHHGKLLLAQRGANSDQAGLWEFPGGKLETGETQQQALQRELQEELAIDARIDRYIASEKREVSGRIIHLHGWLVTNFDGDLKPSTHQALAWCIPTEALTYDLAPADIPLLQAWLTAL